MKARKKLIVLTYIVFAGCAVSKPSQQSKVDNLLPYGPAWAALWQQRSAEYKALCFQAYNIAKKRLDEELRKTVNKPLAIITDIDETVLGSDLKIYERARAGYVFMPEIRCQHIPGASLT